MNDLKTVYLSIGSNLGDRLRNLQKAVFSLHREVGTVVALSRVYESPSWGFEAGNFLNAAVGLETELSPQKVLERILAIEKEMGRERTAAIGYQSRNIDIDIIYYEYEIIETPELTIPHPQMTKRRFVLRPLSDIAPQFYHPILNKDTRNLIQESRDKTNPEKTNYRLYKNRQELFSNTQFIAIEGNIGAGKTTLARKMANDFNAKLVLERFAENPFLPNFYKDQTRYAFPLEMSFLADRYQQFTDDTSQYDLFKNFMISDYDIFKSLIFAGVTLQKAEYELYKKVFNFMYKEVTKPRIYVYLYQQTDRLIYNIKKRGRDYEQGITPEYLNQINRGYFDFLKSYPEENSLVIDITDMDFVEDENDYNTIVTKIQDFAIGQSLLT